MSDFQRRHYDKLAEVVRSGAYPERGGAARLDLALALSRMLQQDNPNFNKNKFLKACGFDGREYNVVPTEMERAHDTE